ncbi:MAG: hypothetical protein ABI016_08090 [Chthoniobacterales bacterium]
MRLIRCVLAFVIFSGLLVGCATNRNLKVTEVTPNQVELLLDESNPLILAGTKLKWISQDRQAQPVSGELDLGVAGTLRGGQFLVIFEDPIYSGYPVAQTVGTSTPGIKVRNDFFPSYGPTPSVSMSVQGNHYRSYVLFIPAAQDLVNDVVRFGPRPRPPTSGGFLENGSLDAVKPVGRDSVSRKFIGRDAVDTDNESDWSSRPASLGVPTPP